MPFTEQAEEPAAEDRSNLEWKEILSILNDKYRVPLELFYGQGFPAADIARVCGVPVSTIQTRLARGREKLKEYYQNELEVNG